MRVQLISALLLLTCAARAQQKDVLVVYFDFDKHQLSIADAVSIDSLIRVQQARDATITKIELSGHCDFIGPDGYNDLLSSKRVNEVKRLILSGNVINPAIISTAAYGEKQPLNENRTSQDRQVNRRVEITITAAIGDNMRVDAQPVKLSEQIADSSTTSGTNIVLRNINFYGGMHILMRESDPMLQELLDAMKTYPNLIIEIQGHICCESRPGDGMDMQTGIYNLSTARAKAIYDHLITNGIQPARVSYKGFGHSQPIYPFPEQSEAQRVANRRVEIRIISK